MKKIGLTGGIGVGKTYVAEIFKNLGVPVFNADLEAKKCIRDNQDLQKKIAKAFGSKIFENGLFHKNELAKIVFSNTDKMKELSSLVHPQVYLKFNDWCKSNQAQFIIKEAAILFESNSHLSLDKVICVSASKELRIQRVMLRDDCSEDEVLKRISMQMRQPEKEKLSDFIIHNNNDSKLLSQVLLIKQAIDQS